MSAPRIDAPPRSAEFLTPTRKAHMLSRTRSRSWFIPVLGCCFLGSLTNRAIALPGIGDVHSDVWTKGEVIFIDPIMGIDNVRSSSLSSWGTKPTTAYASVQHAVDDVLRGAIAPTFPVVFNVMGGAHLVTDLRLPAFGVKLQKLSTSNVTLFGWDLTLGLPTSGGVPPVLHVDEEGVRKFDDSSLMPASIIQGLTIRDGGTGILLDVPTSSSDYAGPIRTEIRDCLITENKYRDVASEPNGLCFGGRGIQIVSHAAAPTRYVIENNEISHHADFFDADVGPPSFGILFAQDNGMHTPGGGHDSTLIRGNTIFDQETGIGIYGYIQNTWVRPRIMSNFLMDHEQHIWSVQGAGPVLIHNTLYRIKDFCLGTDRHMVGHYGGSASTVNPLTTYNAMIVRDCVIEHDAFPVGFLIADSWPIASFRGSPVFVSNSDFEPLSGAVLVGTGNDPSGVLPLFVASGVTNPQTTQLHPVFLTQELYSFAFPADLHLLPGATQINDGVLADSAPGFAIWLDTEWVPCDVRTDIDSEVRVIDCFATGAMIPDRGGDEVALPSISGLVLTLDNGTNPPESVAPGSTFNLRLQGVPSQYFMIAGWLDDPANPLDDVVQSNTFLAPFGNVLLPLGGLAILTSGSLAPVASTNPPAGSAALPLFMPMLPLETQFYYQAVSLDLANPVVGNASNRIRVEVNP